MYKLDHICIKFCSAEVQIEIQNDLKNLVKKFTGWNTNAYISENFDVSHKIFKMFGKSIQMQFHICTKYVWFLPG